VDVTASASEDRRFACSAAKDALQLLGLCNISLHRPLRVHIMSEVRHPSGEAIFGFFDANLERVLVTQEESIPALVEGTPYAVLPTRDFYRSLIVHEIIHGVMHQNFKRPPRSRAAYEYPAYALQIESLPVSVRDKFLQSVPKNTHDFLFNDTILLFDPFFFAARAYEHFKSSSEGCRQVRALLEGEVAFIAPAP
jgi:hypothetical protein